MSRKGGHKMFKHTILNSFKEDNFFERNLDCKNALFPLDFPNSQIDHLHRLRRIS